MPRLVPLTAAVDLSSRRGLIRLSSNLEQPERYVFTVDMYSHLRERHPETHIGWWRFALPRGAAESRIEIDLRSIGPGSLWRETPQGREAAIDSWSNAGYVFDPVIGIQLVLRSTRGRVLENRFVAGNMADPEVLRSYYHRVHESGSAFSYTPPEPFLRELHAMRLRRLERLFTTFIPKGGRVLDAGCGRSLFTEIRPRWPFQIVAADLDCDVLRWRRRSFGELRYAVADARLLPFREASFDAVFAGELIEHLPDPRQAVREMRRVLRPGGALILTTPNRLRLANRVDGSERPYGPDHLSELSYDEVLALLREERLSVVRRSGLHLELLLNYFSPLPKLDLLQRSWNRAWAVPLMRVLLAAGHLLPRYAVDLILVARAS